MKNSLFSLAHILGIRSFLSRSDGSSLVRFQLLEVEIGSYIIPICQWANYIQEHLMVEYQKASPFFLS